MNDRFDRIEKLILADHKRRIERLEEQVKDLRDLLAVRHRSENRHRLFWFAVFLKAGDPGTRSPALERRSESR